MAPHSDLVTQAGTIGTMDYAVGGNLINDNYLAIGETRSNTVKIENRYRYTSREFVETNLYYRARHMRPDLGRFISMDPLKTVDGTNMFGYVGNDPVDFFDPNGLWISCVSASDTHWIGLGSLLHRLPGGHTKWLFNLVWFDAECPQCESPTSPSVRSIVIKGYPALPIHIYIQANPQIEFVEQESKNHLRYGVSVQTRLAGWMPS